MNEQKYPKRGQVSEDGQYYTHKDGTVHEHSDTNCQACSAFMYDFNCSVTPRNNGPCGYHVIEGAYVLSADELEACDMARKAIEQCGRDYVYPCQPKCKTELCEHLVDKTCHLRKWLERCGQADAWTVMP